jgi:hypothetical protein
MMSLSFITRHSITMNRLTKTNRVIIKFVVPQEFRKACYRKKQLNKTKLYET